MKTKLALGLAMLALAGCASDPPPSPPPPPVEQAPPPPPPEPDHCGLAEAKKFVGRPRTDIPVPVRPNLQRVYCSTCPVTMDFNEKRLNFVYGAATGIVKEVKCG
jgi:hypothetical protein